MSDPFDELSTASGAQPIPSSFDAETAENNEAIEQQFAVVCMDQAEAYHNLITSIRPSSLARLTAHDDQILAAFEAVFPEIALDDERLKKISEDEMKSPEGKEKWRGLMKGFENIVTDYNFGTLLRADAEEDYTEANSIFVLRVQFFAVEIARNRRGLNDKLWAVHQAAKEASVASP